MIINKKHENVLLCLALGVFFLNDLIFLFNSSAIVFYLSDYILKGLIFIGIILTLRQDNTSIQYLRVPGESIPRIIIWTIVLVITGVFIDQWVWRNLYKVLPEFSLQLHFYLPSNRLHKLFDLTVGIFLVAFTEEYIFRYLIIKKLRNKFSVILSAFFSLIIFGLIHWSFGPTAILSTMLWALLPLVSVFRLKTLLPAIIAHYFTDVAAFSGVIEKCFGGV